MKGGDGKCSCVSTFRIVDHERVLRNCTVLSRGNKKMFSVTFNILHVMLSKVEHIKYSDLVEDKYGAIMQYIHIVDHNTRLHHTQ